MTIKLDMYEYEPGEEMSTNIQMNKKLSAILRIGSLRSMIDNGKDNFKKIV